MKIRVATFNILYGRYASPEEIGRWLKTLDPQLVCLCECPGEYEWLDRAAAALELPYYVVGALSSGLNTPRPNSFEEVVGIAGRTMKFKAVFGCRPLEPLGEVICDGRGWSNGSATRARTTIDGRRFVVHSLHIAGNPGDESGTLERGHSHALAESVATVGEEESILMAGDFNNRIDDPALLLLEKAGLRPTWRDLGTDADKAFSYCTFTPANQDNRLIDHIYYDLRSGARAVDGGILEREQPLSDHKPVWSELEYPDESKRA